MFIEYNDDVSPENYKYENLKRKLYNCDANNYFNQKCL